MLDVELRTRVLHAISLLERGFVPGDGPMTIAKACEQSQINYAQFMRAVKDPELKELYENAKTLSEDLLAEALLSIDEFYPDSKMASVVSKNVQWVLSRRRREDYGDHVTVEHTTTRDQQLLDEIRKSRERVEGPALIEGEAEPVDVLTALGLGANGVVGVDA